MAMYNASLAGGGSSVTIDDIVYEGDLKLKSSIKDIRMPDLPYEFYSGGAVVYRGELHILGSANNNNYTKHFKFNGTEWVEVSTLPCSFFGGSAYVYEDEIYISCHYNTQDFYKFNGSSWTQLDSSSNYVSYWSSPVVVYRDAIYYIGVYKYSDYQTLCKYKNSVWTSLGRLPFTPWYSSASVCNDEIHVTGGNSNLNKHYKYNGSWTQVGTMPYDMNAHILITFNNELHNIGGYCHSNSYMAFDNSAKHIKYNGTSWEELNDIPFKVNRSNAVIYDDCICVLGGDVQTTHDVNSTGVTPYYPDEKSFYKIDAKVYELML